jgi:DNA-binding LytR/AlgR family response regulator
MTKKIETLAKNPLGTGLSEVKDVVKNPVQTGLSEASIENPERTGLSGVEKNNHFTLLEFEEGTIVLEELRKRTWVVIQLNDIMNVSVKGNYCSLHLKLVNKVVVFKITMEKLMSMLPPNYFWRVHKSNIVGRKHIFKFIQNADGGGVVLLHDGTGVDVSPAFMETVKKAIKEKAHFLPVEKVKVVDRAKKSIKAKKNNI